MTDPILRSCHDMMEALTQLLEGDPDGGRVVMSFSKGHWVVGIEWGLEAPDSPMVGAAAYASDKVAVAALDDALRQAGV